MWKELYEGLKAEVLELILEIVNKIWGRRNGFVFENKFWNPGRVVQEAVIGMKAHWEVNGRERKVKEEVANEREVYK